MRLFLACLALLGSIAHAASQPYDLTDLWWDPANSGWAVSVHQQGQVLFVTVLMYGEDGNAEWYIAGMAPKKPTLDYLHPEYTGDLYTARGPMLGTPDFASLVNRSRVGSIRIRADSGRSVFTIQVGSREYSASLVRYAWSAIDLSGTYDGLVTIDPYSCDEPFDAPSLAAVFVDQTGSDVRITVDQPMVRRRCDIVGVYSANGTSGSITGNATCRDTTGATTSYRFDATDVRLTNQALTMHYSFGNAQCGQDGTILGARLQ